MNKIHSFGPRKRFKKTYVPPGNASPYEHSVWFLSTFTGRTIRVRPDESPKYFLRRFEKMIEISGIMREMKKREFFMTASQSKKEKKKRAEKKLRKRLRSGLNPEIVHQECKPGICYAPPDWYAKNPNDECKAYYAFAGASSPGRPRPMESKV